MVMGNKIIKIEDSLFVIGGYILDILLKNHSMQVDELYAEFISKYPKRIDFETFIYAVDFLFLIHKIKIQSNDILEVVKWSY